MKRGPPEDHTYFTGGVNKSGGDETDILCIQEASVRFKERAAWSARSEPEVQADLGTGGIMDLDVGKVY